MNLDKPLFIITAILLLSYSSIFAQIEATLLKSKHTDSLTASLNMDAVYNRPFLGQNKSPVSLGGYLEVNWQHLGTDGVSEGHQFQARRLTLFVASTISKRVRFLSEIELEEGGKSIAIEFAAADVEFHPLFNLRGGVVMNPIGAFNQNHDGPKWEFTDRPFSAVQLLPATWSNAGFGLYGKHYSKDWMIGYEAYLTGGFDGSIIENTENKTFLPAAKINGERFEEGNTLFTSKIALGNNKIGELGLSYMEGIYNKPMEDGIVLDKKRKIQAFALDFNTTIPKLKTVITAEWVWIKVNVPQTYSQQFGNKQQGGFMDIVQPIFKKSMLNWEAATFSLACRLEYVDWNIGTFRETGGNIGDRLWSVMPGLSFRPTPRTVLRLNYRYLRQQDILNNPPSVTGGFIFGFSTYF